MKGKIKKIYSVNLSVAVLILLYRGKDQEFLGIKRIKKKRKKRNYLEFYVIYVM